jgi:hypothetical protein
VRGRDLQTLLADRRRDIVQQPGPVAAADVSVQSLRPAADQEKPAAE